MLGSTLNHDFDGSATSLQIFAPKAPNGQTPKAYLFPHGDVGATGVVADRLLHNAVFAKQTGVFRH
jgi:hypothetical protein